MVEDLMERVKNLLEEAKKKISSSSNLNELYAVKSEFLGKKGKLSSVLKSLKTLPPEKRPALGKVVNQVRDEVVALIDERESFIVKKEKEERIKSETIDVSLTGRIGSFGGRHPLSLVRDEVVAIFRNMGFTPVEGPELEEEYYNFDALNIPKHHPARDEQDSFYIDDTYLLRTQTSPVQIRTMLENKPPIAVVSPGRCFRRDAVDSTHSHTFHQIEGLLVDENVSFSDLKGTLLVFAKKFFGEETKIRLRPDYFPFTEPSAEVAVSCPVCGGKGCRVCSYTGWLEIAGCGMVHPKVFESVGYDHKKVSGFAFGMGIERLAMVKYGVDDIRLFFDNDKRFLSSF